MLILLAALNLSLDLGPRKPATPPAVVCNIRTVSYKFVGEPNTEFRYAGDRYRVPVGGTIELIASPKAVEYQFEGKSLPLDVWAADEFGTRTVPLPKPQQRGF